jgi:hypothetical protein
MQNKIFQTKDFYAASFIIASGCKLLNCEREKSFTVFNFEDTESLRKLVTAFYSMKATIEPMSFSQIIRSLKSVIHASNSTGSINNVKESV